MTTHDSTQGPSLNSTWEREAVPCITHDEYLYVFGGTINADITMKFERINLNDYESSPNNTQWTIIDSFDWNNVYCPDGSQLYIYNGYLELVSWRDDIFLIGNGWFGYNDYIGIFNTETGQLNCSDAPWPNEMIPDGDECVSHMTATIGGDSASPYNERLYVFGGFRGDFSVNYTVISNNLTEFTKSPTKSPTTSPTLTPTTDPTEPSPSPTKSPTNSPTSNPSLQPTTSPSSEPSLMPSFEPTLIPTFGVIGYNNSVLIQCILYSMDYGVNELNNSDSLQRDLIRSIRIATIDVRFNIENNNDFDVIISNISNDENNNTSNQTYKTQIEFLLSMASSDEVDEFV